MQFVTEYGGHLNALLATAIFACGLIERTWLRRTLRCLVGTGLCLMLTLEAISIVQGH